MKKWSGREDTRPITDRAKLLKTRDRYLAVSGAVYSHAYTRVFAAVNLSVLHFAIGIGRACTSRLSLSRKHPTKAVKLMIDVERGKTSPR